jgi:hypothetical protein
MPRSGRSAPRIHIYPEEIRRTSRISPIEIEFKYRRRCGHGVQKGWHVPACRCLSAKTSRPGGGERERLGMSNIGHWVTGIALIKARDTCGVVIGFRSRSVHRDLTLPPPCFRPVSIFKTLFHTERVSLTKTNQKQLNSRRSCRIICHIPMKKRIPSRNGSGGICLFPPAQCNSFYLKTLWWWLIV